MPSRPYLKINLNQCSASSKRNILFFPPPYPDFWKKGFAPPKVWLQTTATKSVCGYVWEYVCDRPPLFPLKSHLLTLLTPLALGGQVLVDLVALKTHKQEIGPDFHKMHCQEGASSKLQHLCNKKCLSVNTNDCEKEIISWPSSAAWTWFPGSRNSRTTAFNHQTSGQS